jgi:CPA2 family monovalent cation:H+ antiporter-2
MPHASPLITIIVLGIGLAFVFGTIANRLRISPLVGYLLAGVAVGPTTPGFVADQALASQLAEIGVILLMFGVGLHFSLKDLLAVRRIVVPGALAQMAVSVALGIGLAHWFGWALGSGLVFGLALSVASTVVLMRALADHHLLDSERGHLAVGWLVFQDLLTVIALVLLPPLAPLLAGGAAAALDPMALAVTLGITLGKVAAFVALMLIVGRRVVPAILHYVAHTGSRELFRLAVLSVALGVAFAATELFGVSFALGAFFAGMILSESQLSQRAAEETLPLRDAFAVLFFVSVGMLFDPLVLLREPVPLLGTLLVVLIGNAGGALIMMRLLGLKLATALVIAAGLAQIGEFSFILADLGIGLGLLSTGARDLILGASLLSILINPLLFELIDWLKARARPAEPAPQAAAAPHDGGDKEVPMTALKDHAVLIGYGRVGQIVAHDLMLEGWPLLVIDDSAELVEKLRAEGVEAIAGNAADDRVLRAANLPAARLLLVAIPEAFEAGQIVQQARKANPSLEIIARAHFDAAVDHLTQHGANVVIMGEREIAHGMSEHVRSLRPDAAASS